MRAVNADTGLTWPDMSKALNLMLPFSNSSTVKPTVGATSSKALCMTLTVTEAEAVAKFPLAASHLCGLQKVEDRRLAAVIQTHNKNSTFFFAPSKCFHQHV